MKALLKTFLDMMDPMFLRTHNQALMQAELPQTSPANEAAAEYVYRLLRAENFDAEKVDFHGDGRTAHQDKILPLCWDASMGRLTVLTPWEGNPVIADYEQEPFSLIRYSVTTPQGGLETRLVTWDAMCAGEDVRGALVLLPGDMYPKDDALVPVLKAGAAGLVNGMLCGGELQPDCTHWANNCTETNSWFVNADEQDFVGYCVTPNIHRKLWAACKAGEVRVRAESDGRRYEGSFWGVTALLPGESTRELGLEAHLAEPLEDDNSAGVIASVEILRQLRAAVNQGSIPTLQYSVRVLFAPEMYGFAAFADRFGGRLRDRCIGALSLDGMAISRENPVLRLNFAPPAVPFYGNAIFEGVAETYNAMVPYPPFVLGRGDHYGDDAFLSDGSVGLPTIMPMHATKVFWHNSHQRYGYVDYAQFARHVAIYATFAAATAAPDVRKLEAFLPQAVAYAERRLAELAYQAPPRAGSCPRARLAYWTDIESARLEDFRTAGVTQTAIDKAVTLLRAYANALIPAPAADKTAETPVFDAAAKIIPSRAVIGFPHDLARVPKALRWHPMPDMILYGPMARVLSNMDGKKNLQQLYRETEWEENAPLSEETLQSYTDTILFLAQYEYLTLSHI